MLLEDGWKFFIPFTNCILGFEVCKNFVQAPEANARYKIKKTAQKTKLSKRQEFRKI